MALQRLGIVVIIVSIMGVYLLQWASTAAAAASYRLSSSAQALAGESQQSYSDKLKYDQRSQVYAFNDNPTAAQLPGQTNGQQVGGSAPYGVTFSQNSSKGVSVYDAQTKLSFSMTPQFATRIAKKVQDRVVYPLTDSNQQLVYTLEAGGVKENMIVNTPQGDSAQFSYKLKLPSELQARTESSGGIGIYSANPSLFGNITYGTAKDQASVEAARHKSPKNHLVFFIPAPVIKQTGDGRANPGGSQAHFSLQGDTLTVAAERVGGLQYPISIDPSTTIASATSFAYGGNFESDMDTSGNTIARGALSGGAVGAFGAASTLNTARQNFGAAAYNGYLYAVGGQNASGTLSSVEYASISSGTLGTWTTSGNSLNTARKGLGVSVYNGYLYAVGGFNASSTALASVEYARINGDGSVNTWTNGANSLTTARAYLGCTVYNGYLYAVGGTNDGSTPLSNVQYSKLTNGVPSAWQTANSFITARYGAGVSAVNGYLYIMGGTNGSSLSDMQYAAINANGSVGTWQTGASFATARTGLVSVAYNGYLYVLGGYDGTNYLTDNRFAQITKAGTTSIYSSTSSLSGTNVSSGINGAGAVAYNGYIYDIGGYNGTSYIADVRRAPIDTTAGLGSWSTATSLKTGVAYYGLATLNGYIYVIGGLTAASTATTEVQFTKINYANNTLATWADTTVYPNAIANQPAAAYNGYLYGFGTSGIAATTGVYKAQITASDGTISAWTSTNSFATGRLSESAVAYNGYMYLAGGKDSSYFSDVQYAQINSDGTLGTWASAGNAMGTARSLFGLIAVNGYLYAIGGETTGAASLSSAEFAAIKNDGTLNGWTANTSLTTTVKDAQYVTSSGMVYAISGINGGSRATSTQYSTINNGGLGLSDTWQTAQSSFGSLRWQHAAVAYNGNLYIMGGTNGTATFDDIEISQINANGTLGNATTSSVSLPETLSGLAAVAYNGNLYIMGGNHAGTRRGTTYYLPFKNDGSGAINGTTATWMSGPATPFTARATLSAAAYNGYLYISGGTDGTSYLNDVQYVAINSDGSLGSWTPTTPFNGGRSAFGLQIYNGYMYVLGGYNGNPYSDVQYAQIASNGTVGTWNYTTSLVGTRYNLSSFAANGAMCVLGGISSLPNSVSNDAWCAPISSGGGLGNWQAGLGKFTNNRQGQTAVIYNGYIFMSGGRNGSGANYYADTQSAALDVTARIGSYSRLIDTGVDTTPTKMVINGTNTGNANGGGPGMGGIQVSYMSAPNATAAFGASQVMSLGIGSPFGIPFNYTAIDASGNTTLGASRYYWLNYTLDDSQTGSFPDSNGNATSLSRIRLFWRANSAFRLRHGDTFLNGTQQGLDASP